MFERAQSRVLPVLIENKALKAMLALIGALMVAAGFQGYSLGFVPSGVLVGGGILIEVSLVYVVSIGIETARRDIMRQRKEIDEMVREVRDIGREVDQAKNEVRDVRGDVDRTQKQISDAQREIQEASRTAQNAKKEIEEMERSISRGLSRF